MKVAAVIPVRMGSSRFPGKPLAKILGISMVEHVFQRSRMSKLLDDVYIATCDKEIREVAEGFGAQVIMTAATHHRASDRVAEAAEKIEADIIVLIQGDEPMTTPEMIDAAVLPMLDNPEVQCINLAARIKTEDEFLSPNTIKVVVDINGDALYFSREPIPTKHLKEFSNLPAYKQVCIIPFRSEILQAYANLEPTPLEIAESIDMMRFLEHGFSVRMVATDVNIYAVDTPADLAQVEGLMRNDPVVAQYLK
jgi:3-deoxy-manno-octulosonate cytidylyltransferase (CMP-KDO synthetase)